MHGGNDQQGGMWSYTQPEQRVSQTHPLRPIRAMVDSDPERAVAPVRPAVLAHRPAPISPEQLLRALPLQAFRRAEAEGGCADGAWPGPVGYYF